MRKRIGKKERKRRAATITTIGKVTFQIKDYFYVPKNVQRAIDLAFPKIINKHIKTIEVL